MKTFILLWILYNLQSVVTQQNQSDSYPESKQYNSNKFFDIDGINNQQQSSIVQDKAGQILQIFKQENDKKLTNITYIYINPLKQGMYPTPAAIKNNSKAPLEEPTSIFFIPRQSTVQITIDLRHIINYTNYNLSFTYGKDKEWDILIQTIDYSVENVNSSKIDILEMPEIFQRETTQKIFSHQFSVFTYKDLYMMINLRILKPQYQSQRQMFTQCASIQISTPYRAILRENKTIGFVLLNNQIVNLPLSLPNITSNTYPDAIITYTPIDTNDQNEVLIPFDFVKQDKQQLWFQLNNELFWGNLKQLAIPYIPFITNCKNYGEFIFLSDIIENPKYCSLYSASDTIPVEQLGFLQKPTSDTCENVAFTCILDDAFFTSLYPKYYESMALTELFYIVSEPIDFQQDIITDDIQYNPLSLIPVIAQNAVPSNSLPKEITLTIQYYQVNKYQKRIVKSFMSFGNYIDKANLNSNQTFYYKFYLNLHSMNHAELAISFAFDIPIYVILSIIIGFFSIMMVLFYYCFFRISNRQFYFSFFYQIFFSPNNLNYFQNTFRFLNFFYSLYKIIVILFIQNRVFRRANVDTKPFMFTKNCCSRVCKDLSEFIQFYKPIFTGIVLGFIPNFILLFFSSLLMVGGFWDNPFFNCIDLNSENICETSIFESFGSQQVSQKVRRGRLGLTLIVLGLYACVRISKVFVPLSQQEKVRETAKNYQNELIGNKRNKFFQAITHLEDRNDFLTRESYDGNIWSDKVWLRGLFVFMTFLILVIYIVVISLSFSAYYGANIWFFTFVLKFSQIIIEECLKIYIENELLLATLSCVISMSNSVSGLGAADFFDYLFNTFINLGISTFEKTNQVLVVDLVADQIKEYFNYINNWISKIFNIDFFSDELNEDMEEEKNKKQRQNQSKDYNENSQATGQNDDGNSSIYLTDNCEDSLMSIDFEENWDTEKEEKAQKIKYQNSIKLFDEQKTISKLQSKNIKHVKIMSKTIIVDEEFEKDLIEIGFDELINQKYNRITLSQALRQQTKGKFTDYQENENSRVNFQLKIFGDFCNNTFNLLATPFQVLALWMFYYPNQMFVKWGITKKGLIYYYLFNILNIPFQMMVDILFLKTVEQFHNINVREYFFFVNEKFKKRYLTWKVDEEDIDEIHNKLEPDLKYIHKWCFSPQFFFCLSIFIGGDSSSFFYIIMLWIPFCFVVDFICVSCFCNRIWGIKEKEEKQLKGEDSEISSSISSNQQKVIQKATNFKPSFQFDKQGTQKIVEGHMINVLSQENLFQKSSLPIHQQQEFPQENTINWLQTSRMVNSMIPDYVKNHTAKSKFKFEDTHNIIFQKTLPYPDFYSKLNQQLNDESFIDGINVLKSDLDKDRYLKLYLQQQVDNLYNYDISVHQYIITNIEKEEEKRQNLQIVLYFGLIPNYIIKSDKKMFNLLMHNFRRFKIQLDAMDQYQKLKKFDFLKAIQEKEKKSRYQEIKSQFEEFEYKDEKFLLTFLKINKNWLRKNMKLFFDDLIHGESKKQLKKLRKKILERFSKIYGDIKNEGQKQEILLKNVFKKRQPLKSDIIQYQNTSLHSILKYWVQRCKVLRIAQQYVGGYFLRSNQKHCQYCYSNWGLTVQTNQINVEDLFSRFYKRECKRFGFKFNIFELLENEKLIFEPFIKKQKYMQSQHSHTALFFQDDDGDNYLNPSKSTNNEYVEFDEEYDMNGEFTSSIFHQIKGKILIEQKQKKIYMFKQKFIVGWQDYFSENANLISICLKCNDQSQDLFVQRLTEERKNKDMQQLMRDTISVLNNQKNNYNINQPILIDLEEIEGQKNVSQTPTFIFNPYVIKKVGDHDSNQIIEEENNEDQSQNEDTLSKFDDSLAIDNNDKVIQKQSTQQIMKKNNRTVSNIPDQLILNDIYNENDDSLQGQRRESIQHNKSMRSMKSQESKTHPVLTEQDEMKVQVNEHELQQINKTIQDENNRSFKVHSARKNSRNTLAFFDDFQEKDEDEKSLYEDRSNQNRSDKDECRVFTQDKEEEVNSEEELNEEYQNLHFTLQRQKQFISSKDNYQIPLNIQSEPSDRQSKGNNKTFQINLQQYN